jgi:rhodanese-related sulfurtransferase
LAEQLADPNPPIVLDVRARAQYDQDTHQIPESVRVLPDQIEAWTHTEPPQSAVITYCT